MTTFAKYHGTGNDFILIDDRESTLQFSAEQIQQMCHRHFGIGADGLILIRNDGKNDFRMDYYNSDGQIGSMCGNGGRCAVAFASALGLINSSCIFSAFDGNHRAEVVSIVPFVVRLEMKDVSKIEAGDGFLFLNTGSPLYIQFRECVDKIDIVTEGRRIRNSERFKSDGVNVNFVETNQNSIYLRTYERGVENETLSCGTGITASVLAAAFSGYVNSSPCDVETPGGNLKVHFQREGDGFKDIWLEGQVEFVFTGVMR
jgi:diaminopimelate epimerase